MTLKHLITHNKPALLSQWEARDSGQVLAFIRVYDPSSPWEWYIIAQNPDYGDEIYALVNGFRVESEVLSLSELEATINGRGEKLETDPHFLPVRVNTLLTKLKGNHGY